MSHRQTRPPPAPETLADPRLLERLLLYAARRTARVAGAAVERPEDYVQRAVTLTLGGLRRQSEGVDLFAHLAGVVSSLVSHDAARGRRTGFLEDAPPGRQWPSPDPNAEDALALIAEAERQEALKDAILRALADDPLACRVARLLMEAETPPPPRALAALLGVAVDEVYRARKRLQRRIGPMLERGSP